MKITDARKDKKVHLIAIAEGDIFELHDGFYIRLDNGSEGDVRFASLETGEAFTGSEKLLVTKVCAELVVR